MKPNPKPPDPQNRRGVDMRLRVVNAVAAVYAAAGAVADKARAATVETSRSIAVVARYLGPAIALATPLHCGRCRRTQHYASPTTHRLIAQGILPRCWWCGRRMTRPEAQETSR